MRRIPGSHEPNAKNRSSKHLAFLTKMKPAVRSLNNAALAELANCKFGGEAARKELKRRQDKRAKKDSK